MRWLMLGSVLFYMGCGPDCLSTCQRLHGDGFSADNVEQCNITVPGEEQSDLIRSCTASCEYAMARAGDLDGYAPNVRTPPSEAQALSNEAQAAAWMDCVGATACPDLGNGYCAPTQNYGR